MKTGRAWAPRPQPRTAPGLQVSVPYSKIIVLTSHQLGEYVHTPINAIVKLTKIRTAYRLIQTVSLGL